MIGPMQCFGDLEALLVNLDQLDHWIILGPEDVMML